jgi:hypothetical protein
MPATALALDLAARAAQRAAREVSLQVTVPSVGVGATSPMYAIDAQMRAGMLVKLDAAIAAGVDATVTLTLYTKDDQAVGSVYTLVRVTGLTGDYHALIETPWTNADVPQTALLYLQVVHTAGAAVTGAIPVLLTLLS